MRERGRRGQHQFLLHGAARQPVEYARDFLHRFGDDEIQRLAFFRQLDRAVQAAKETHAERIFEEFDLPADSRLGDAEFMRRDGKTAQARNRFELDERRHRRNEAPVSSRRRHRRFHPIVDGACSTTSTVQPSFDDVLCRDPAG